MAISSVEITAQNYEVVPTVIANQFRHLVKLAVSTATVSLHNNRNNT